MHRKLLMIAFALLAIVSLVGMALCPVEKMAGYGCCAFGSGVLFEVMRQWK